MKRVVVVAGLAVLAGPVVVWYIAYAFLVRATNPQL